MAWFFASNVDQAKAFDFIVSGSLTKLVVRCNGLSEEVEAARDVMRCRDLLALHFLIVLKGVSERRDKCSGRVEVCV